MKVAIEVKDLVKIYTIGTNKVYALGGVTFDVEQGTYVAIIGPSGSGKSTLLNMLAGLEHPSSGTIKAAGIHIEDMTENDLVRYRREHVGFIFQSYNLIPTMNAVDNVALPLVFRGIDKATRTDIAIKYLELVGLKDQMYHNGNEMSGGQQQRVGIARALATDPEIIFADEPTGNLDTKTSLEVLDMLRHMVVEQGKTLIMVTHDNNIASYADRRIRLVDGLLDNNIS